MGQVGTKFISFFPVAIIYSTVIYRRVWNCRFVEHVCFLLLPLIFLQLDQAVFRILIDNRKKNKERNKLISTVLITVTVQAVVYLLFWNHRKIYR